MARVVGLHPGYRFITDYDFVPPSIIAFVFLFYLMDKHKAIAVRVNPMGIALNGLLLGVFVYLSFNFHRYETLWYVVAVLTLLSALFIVLHPRELFLHPQSGLVPVAIVAALSKIIGRQVFASFWGPASKVTAHLSCLTLNPLLSNLSCEFDVLERSTVYHLLHHPLFSIAIGVGCSGLEGVFFFVFLAGLVLMVKAKEWNPLGSFLFLVLGTVGIYAMNIVRINLFYLAAIGAHSLWGATQGVEVFLVLFHGSVGWLIYLLFFVGYFIAMEKWLSTVAFRSTVPLQRVVRA